MKIQKDAVNILERTTAYLQAGLLSKPPAWYGVVAQIPPSTKFFRKPNIVDPTTGKSRIRFRPVSDSRNARTDMYKTRSRVLDRRNSISSLYKIPKLKFVEDELRKLFYEQHPWELTRPKILIENYGDDNLDWSNLQQLGKALDGESVVQRTMYLLKNKEHSDIKNAYDQARMEFYRLRIQEDVQNQVALEEAEMFGASFGPTAIEYGVQKEQETINKWKDYAIKQMNINEAKRAKQNTSWGSDEDVDVNANEEETTV